MRNHQALWVFPATILFGCVYFAVLHEPVGVTLLMTFLILWLPGCLCYYLFCYLRDPDQRPGLNVPLFVSLGYCLFFVFWIAWSSNVVANRREEAKTIARKARR